MKTFLSDIFPKIQRYSEKLDNLTLLTNQHWVFIDDMMSNKTVYIFRSNNELLISQNGKVEKAKWEYLGNQSLLIDQKSESYLFKHGFFDENILALKIDSKEEYAIFVNENKYDGELNSIDAVSDFLKRKYLDSSTKHTIGKAIGEETMATIVFRGTIDNKTLKIVLCNNKTIGAKVYINDKLAEDGAYIFKPLTYKIIVKNGEIKELYYLEKIKNMILEKKSSEKLSIGDKVYLSDWRIAPNEKYKIGLMNFILVEYGKIIKFTSF